MNEEYLKALGRVVNNFSSLEYRWKEMIISTFNFDYVNDINLMLKILSKKSFRGLLDITREIAEIKFISNKNIYDIIIKLVYDGNTINDKRNDIIHSSWLTDNEDENKPLTKFNIKRKTNNECIGEMKEYTAEDINKVADEIKTVYKNLFNVLKEIIIFKNKNNK